MESPTTPEHPEPTLSTMQVGDVAVEHIDVRTQPFSYRLAPEKTHITSVHLGGQARFTVAGNTAVDQADELLRIATKLSESAYVLEAACETDDVAQVSAALDGTQ